MNTPTEPIDPTRWRTDETTRAWIVDWLRLLAEDRTIPEKLERAASLARRGGTWEALLPQLRAHGLASRAFALLGALPAELVPERLQRDLTERWQQQQVWALLIQKALQQVGRAFDERSVRFAVLKGPVLAARLHGDPAARDYIDLDLLVPPHDRARAVAALSDLGYVAHYRRIPHRRLSTLRAGSSVSFAGPRRTCVDLHWGLGGRSFRFDLERCGLWERTSPVTIQGRSYDGLGPEDQLVYLCAHGAKHLWERWTWIADVARLAGGHTRLDSDRASALAAKTGSTRMLHMGLLLARNLGSARLPQDLARLADKDPSARALARQIQEALLAGDVKDVNSWRRLAWRLQLRERPHDRAWDLLGFLLEAARPKYDGAAPPRHPILGHLSRSAQMIWKHRSSWRGPGAH